jgi:hypothetical protein
MALVTSINAKNVPIKDCEEWTIVQGVDDPEDIIIISMSYTGLADASN